MKPFSKIPLIVLGVVAIFFAIATFYSYFAAKRKALSYEFNGTVDTVYYNEKGGPTIAIHGIKYDLALKFWDFDHQIQTGDSLIKKKNSLEVKIFKDDGTIIIKQ